jgi:hypothetical protein
MIVAILGVVLGVLAKAYYPWVEAVKKAEAEGKQLEFNGKYVVTALASLAVAGFTAIWALSTFTIPEAESLQSVLALFVSAVMWGYAANYVFSKPVDASKAGSS